MQNVQNHLAELISVIIPCYNHGHYLARAIESVLEQTYPAVEIVVIDDGSTDHTKEVAARYHAVKYVYQSNSGLSAARNRGIKESKGSYLLFLDADDWLYPKALQTNYQYLQQNPKAAFVSGGHDKFNETDSSFEAVQKKVSSEYYKMFLAKGNYIGVPAAVLYQRWVFNEFTFDVTLKACEDYDLYLKISRKYPVLHHPEKIAVYRQHVSNMSSNLVMMLSSSLHVLKMQKPFLINQAERNAYAKGLKFWKSFYVNQFYIKLKSGKIKTSLGNIKVILFNKPQYILRLLADILKRDVQLKMF